MSTVCALRARTAPKALVPGKWIYVDPQTVAWEVVPIDRENPKELFVEEVSRVQPGDVLRQRHVDEWGAMNLAEHVLASSEDGRAWQFWTVLGVSQIWSAE